MRHEKVRLGYISICCYHGTYRKEQLVCRYFAVSSQHRTYYLNSNRISGLDSIAVGSFVRRMKKMRMQQRDNETTREGEGGTDEFTVLSLGNRFREMPMDHGGQAHVVQLIMISKFVH